MNLAKTSLTRAVAAVAAVAATGMALAAEQASYLNDFSARTSGATPSARWMEYSYIPGNLVRPVSSAGDAYNSETAYQDGWTMKANFARTTVPFTVADDVGNQAVLVNPTTSGYVTGSTVAMTPLYNEFTNGVLKVSVDIRTPAASAFNATATAYAGIVPIYKTALDITGTALLTPVRLGMGNLQNSSEFNLRAHALGANASRNGAQTYGYNDASAAIASGRWYRYEATIDIAAESFTASFADLGTEHPTPDREPTSATFLRRWDSEANAYTNKIYLYTPPSDATGGIAGIALYASGFKGDSAANAPMFDNIAVSWKAPGAADFAPVYENDFSARRYRTLSPAGMTSGAYALAPTTNSVQSAYYGCLNFSNVYSIGEASSRYLVPNKTGGHGTLQQIGTDGWRRFDGPLMFTLVNPSYDSAGYGWSNSTVLRPTAASTGGGVETAHGHIAAPLGTALTSGKVRLYFDIMTPHTWHFPSGNSTAWAGVYIGSAHDATLINNSNDAKVILTNKYAFGGGYYINGSNGGTTSSSKWLASTGTTPLSIVNDGSPGQARWYRFRLTGDLEAKTYDIVAWFCGATSGKGADAYGIDDTSFMTDENIRLNVFGRGFSGTSPSALDSVIISVNNASAYDQHGKRNGDTLDVGHYPLFDNIRVCRVNDDGTDGADIYTCDFEYGVRTSVRDAAPLATATDREGADRWIRRGAANGILNVIDAGGGDGVVSMTGVGWASNDRTMFAVQPFGSVTKNCSSVDFAADIRPPACFSAEKSTTTVSSGYARVEVGGDDYEQGVYCPASSSSWRSLASRIGFGFTAVSGKDACTQFTNVVISVQARNAATLTTTTTNATAAIDTSHWYRFRVKANPTNAGGTFAVKVYDQGTAKPAVADADGTLVATFANLDLPVFPEPGMTTFGLAGCNFSGSRGGGLDDPNVALVDNLSATFNPAAMVIIMR